MSARDPAARRHPPRRGLIMAAAAMALLCSSSAAADSWWGPDKAAHLGISTALGAGVYGGLWALSEDPLPLRLTLGVSLALLPGLTKEIHDAGRAGNHFSGRDMVFNGVGALVGAGALCLLELALGRPAPAAMGIAAPGQRGPGVAIVGRF